MTESLLGATRLSAGGLDLAQREVLVVGEVNPISTDPRYALYYEPAGCAGHRLQEKILGLRPRAYLALWRVNLCSGSWDSAVASARARALLESTDAPWRVVVALGVRVAMAVVDSACVTSAERVAMTDIRWARVPVSGSGGREVIFLPHPSGLNRSWSDPRAVDRARELLRAAVPDVAWGSWPQASLLHPADPSPAVLG